MKPLRSRLALLVAGLAVALGCGGKLVEENLSRTTTGTRQGPDDEPPPDDPPLVAIPSDSDPGAPVDGGCCGTIAGWLYHADRTCHDRSSVVAGCVASADAAACDPATATPSCVVRSLADGGREVFALAATWLPASLTAAGLTSCGDGAPAGVNQACNP